MILVLLGAIVPIQASFWFVVEQNVKPTEEVLKSKVSSLCCSYTAAMSAANATPAKIFRSLAMNKDIYGDVSEDAGLIYRDVTLLGYDLITAIKLSVDRAASVWLTEFSKEW